jgi:hypothetical protein
MKKIIISEIKPKEIVIRIRDKNRVTFSKAFFLFAKLTDHVHVYIDEVNKRIAFEFLKSKNEESFTLVSRNSTYYIHSTELYGCDWINSQLQDSNNEFVATLNGTRWVVSMNNEKPKDEKKVIWEQVSNGSNKVEDVAIILNSTSKNNDRIRYTEKLASRAKLSVNKFVKIFFDDKNLRVGFKFYSDEVKGSYVVKGDSKRGWTTNGNELLKISTVFNAISDQKKSFKAVLQAGVWILNLNEKNIKNLKNFEWLEVNSADTESKISSITIGKEFLYFSALFVDDAKIETKKFVKVSFDDDLKKIKFKFFKDEQKGTIKVRGNRKDSFYIAGNAIYGREWVKAVAESSENRFEVKGNSENWYVSIAPAFEICVKRSEISKIPNNLSGLYRYLDKGEIVYIGKGQIRRRYKKKERENWIFDEIQYSIVVDNDIQFFWEKFWIKNFKEQNIIRPRYNKNDGVKND